MKFGEEQAKAMEEEVAQAAHKATLRVAREWGHARIAGALKARDKAIEQRNKWRTKCLDMANALAEALRENAKLLEWLSYGDGGDSWSSDGDFFVFSSNDHPGKWRAQVKGRLLGEPFATKAEAKAACEELVEK